MASNGPAIPVEHRADGVQHDAGEELDAADLAEGGTLTGRLRPG